MRYYKIIQGGEVVGVGTTFLRWQPRSQRFFYCDFEDDPQAVQDVLTEALFHPEWLRRPPQEAAGFTEAEVSLIDATEYDELYALLSDGEEVPVDPEPEPEPTPEPEPDPEPDTRPMTVQEMRGKIAEQERQIAALTDIIMGGI